MLRQCRRDTSMTRYATWFESRSVPRSGTLPRSVPSQLKAGTVPGSVFSPRTSSGLPDGECGVFFTFGDFQAKVNPFQ